MCVLVPVSMSAFGLELVSVLVSVFMLSVLMFAEELVFVKNVSVYVLVYS